jgi:hypothetical protein
MSQRYRTAAEAVDYIEPEPEIGGPDPTAEPMPVPVGLVHAVDEDGRPACRYAGTLIVLGGLWPGMAEEHCPVCWSLVTA